MFAIAERTDAPRQVVVDDEEGRHVERCGADLALGEGQHAGAAVDHHDTEREERVDASADQAEDEDLAHQRSTQGFRLRKLTLPDGAL